MTHSIEELAAWLDAKADAVRIPDPGTGGIVEDRIGTAAWMAPAMEEAARLRAAAKALREMSEALRPFADAFEKQTAGPTVSEPRRNWNARMPGHWDIELKVKIDDGRRAMCALAAAVAGAGER